MATSVICEILESGMSAVKDGQDAVNAARAKLDTVDEKLYEAQQQLEAAYRAAGCDKGE